jgi:diguanylate cyclase (GGDEF)-like protein
MDVEDNSSLIGTRWLDMLDPANARQAAKAIGRAAEGETAHFTIMQPTVKGIPKWWDVLATPVETADGNERLVVISRDVTHQKQSEERVRWIANHDSLTGLPNRLLFQERLDEICAGGGGGFALMLLDMDDFKRVNDTLGHDAGDALLCAFAERLRETTRADDFVARLGGDEFAVILNGVTCPGEIANAGEAILSALRSRISTPAGSWIAMPASAPALSGTRHRPHRAAQARRHRAVCRQGELARQPAIFDGGMRSEMQSRMSDAGHRPPSAARRPHHPLLPAEDRSATGEVAGFEALLRWRHATRGIQTPDSIAPLLRT